MQIAPSHWNSCPWRPFQGSYTTCPCAGQGEQPSRWARISVNCLQKIWKTRNPFQCLMIKLWVALVTGTLAIPCIHLWNRKHRAGPLRVVSNKLNWSMGLYRTYVPWTFQARPWNRRLHPFASLPRGVRSLCSMREPGGLVPLCQIFRFRALFRPHLPFAKQFCKYGWTPSGLPSVLKMCSDRLGMCSWGHIHS